MQSSLRGRKKFCNYICMPPKLFAFNRNPHGRRVKVIPMSATYRHHSAVMRVTKMKTSAYGVLEIRNTGVLTLEAFYVLRPLAIMATMDAPAVVVRLDTAVDVLFQPPSVDRSVYPPATPPQAVVVNESQYLVWVRHAYNLERMGVRRAIFTSRHLACALQWAEDRAHEAWVLRQDWANSGPAPLE